ncbi:hypothetical protein DFH09DRAFT_1087816 [Mycena vulgaris]|nr:hypothetical protein DFH09DRAFT_1087816 [Mycena vulgaris]
MNVLPVLDPEVLWPMPRVQHLDVGGLMADPVLEIPKLVLLKSKHIHLNHFYILGSPRQQGVETLLRLRGMNFVRAATLNSANPEASHNSLVEINSVVPNRARKTQKIRRCFVAKSEAPPMLHQRICSMDYVPHLIRVRCRTLQNPDSEKPLREGLPRCEAQRSWVFTRLTLPLMHCTGPERTTSHRRAWSYVPNSKTKVTANSNDPYSQRYRVSHLDRSHVWQGNNTLDHPHYRYPAVHVWLGTRRLLLPALLNIYWRPAKPASNPRDTYTPRLALFRIRPHLSLCDVVPQYSHIRRCAPTLSLGARPTPAPTR